MDFARIGQRVIGPTVQTRATLPCDHGKGSSVVTFFALMQQRFFIGRKFAKLSMVLT